MIGGLGLSVRAGLLAAAGAAAVLSAGFLRFAGNATEPSLHRHGKADAIVVLTGGAARLAEAGLLLRQGYGRRLLITGANPRAGRDELARLAGLDEAQQRCCLDVDYARDTVGNADEARSWASQHGYASLIVVTASYHMPRSVAELAHAMPEVHLIPHPVVPAALSPEGWWRDAANVRLLAGEYAKYLSASVRLAFSRRQAAEAKAPAGMPQQPSLAGRP